MTSIKKIGGPLHFQDFLPNTLSKAQLLFFSLIFIFTIYYEIFFYLKHNLCRNAPLTERFPPTSNSNTTRQMKMLDPFTIITTKQEDTMVYKNIIKNKEKSGSIVQRKFK